MDRKSSPARGVTAAAVSHYLKIVNDVLGYRLYYTIGQSRRRPPHYLVVKESSGVRDFPRS